MTALLDFRKAFDLVDHHILIVKLLILGVKPTFVNWIIDFLKDRRTDHVETTNTKATKCLYLLRQLKCAGLNFIAVSLGVS